MLSEWLLSYLSLISLRYVNLTGHWRLLLKSWLIKVSSFMMWCNFVDMKHKQGFPQYKHAPRNIWKEVLLLDRTELCLAVDIWVDPAGGGPYWTGLFQAAPYSTLLGLHVRPVTEWFVWVWNGSFLSLTSCALVFNLLIRTVLFCVAVLCFGWIAWDSTVSVECNRIPSCRLCLRSRVGTVRVALATLTGQFITHYTCTLEHIHSG